MAKLTSSYKDFIANHMYKEVGDPLPEDAIITLENKSDVVNTENFNERDLRYLMSHYKLSKMILQCQKCRKLCDLEYDHSDDSIIVFVYRGEYSICSCGRDLPLLSKRYKTRTRQVQLAFKYF